MFSLEENLQHIGMSFKTIFKLKSPSELQCKAKMKADELLYKLIHLHGYGPFDLTMIYHALSHPLLPQHYCIHPASVWTRHYKCSVTQ